MQPTTEHNDSAVAVIKMTVAWLLAAWGAITLQKLVLLATLVYTGLQIYVLVRDKVLRKEK